MFNFFGKSDREKAKEKASKLYEAFLPPMILGIPMIKTNMTKLGLTGHKLDLFIGSYCSGILSYIAQEAENGSMVFTYEDHEATFCEVTEALGIYQVGEAKKAYGIIFNLYRLHEPDPSLSLEDIEREYSRDNPVYVIENLAWESTKACHQHIKNKNIAKITGAFFGKEIDPILVERYVKFYSENKNIISKKLQENQ